MARRAQRLAGIKGIAFAQAQVAKAHTELDNEDDTLRVTAERASLPRLGAIRIAFGRDNAPYPACQMMVEPGQATCVCHGIY